MAEDEEKFWMELVRIFDDGGYISWWFIEHCEFATLNRTFSKLTDFTVLFLVEDSRLIRLGVTDRITTKEVPKGLSKIVKGIACVSSSVHSEICKIRGSGFETGEAEGPEWVITFRGSWICVSCRSIDAINYN